MLLDKELSTNPNVQSIVRARTLAALHILNTARKAIVLRFLHDSDLLQYVKSFLYSLDLSNADLNGIDLRVANLFGADLHGADLSGAHLPGADLRYRPNTYIGDTRGKIAILLVTKILQGARGAPKKR